MKKGNVRNVIVGILGFVSLAFIIYRLFSSFKYELFAIPILKDFIYILPISVSLLIPIMFIKKQGISETLFKVSMVLFSIYCIIISVDTVVFSIQHNFMLNIIVVITCVLFVVSCTLFLCKKKICLIASKIIAVINILYTLGWIIILCSNNISIILRMFVLLPYFVYVISYGNKKLKSK